MTSTTTRPAGYAVQHRCPDGTRWATVGNLPDEASAFDALAELQSKFGGDWKVERIDAQPADRGGRP